MRSYLGKSPRHLEAAKLGVLLLTTASTMAYAEQKAPAAAADEVIVTAQRRAELVSKVPLSITAVSSATIQKFAIEDFTDYAKLAPNLSFGYGVGGGASGVTQARAIAIRGIAGPNTTSFYIDDTPLPQSIDPHLPNLDHIEVLRGPQGTLFGASSMGGTVRVITQAPNGERITGSIDVQGFTVSQAPGRGGEMTGHVTVPIVADEVVASAFAFQSYTPGYFRRSYNDPSAENVTGQLVTGPAQYIENVAAKREEGAGGSLRFTPAAIPGLTVTPLVIMQQTEGNGLPLADFSQNNLVQRRILNEAEAYKDQFFFGALTASYRLPIGRIVSSTSWFQRRTYDQEDGSDGNMYQLSFFTPSFSLPNPQEPFVVPNVSHTDGIQNSVTQELRVESSFDFPINFIAGSFYQASETNQNEQILAPGLNENSGGYFATIAAPGQNPDNVFSPIGSQRQTQIAGFVGVTIVPIKDVEIQAGVRESYLTNYNNFQATGLFFGTGTNYATGSSTTPRASIKYNFDSDTMAYFTYAQGFRVGGANSPLGPSCTGLGLPTTTEIPYTSDSLSSYEGGVKSTLLDKRISISADIYHIDWSHIQQVQVIASGACFTDITRNLGAAVSNGAEFESTMRLTNALSVHLAGGYEDAHLTTIVPFANEVYYPGEPLSGVPAWTAATSADYTVPQPWGNYFARGQYSFTGQSLSFSEVSTGLVRKAYQLVDLRAGAMVNAYTVTLFVKNLLDARPNLSDENPEVAIAPGRYRFFVGQPRTVGVDLKLNF
jgi:iron complex outermembrane receptor protein